VNANVYSDALSKARYARKHTGHILKEDSMATHQQKSKSRASTAEQVRLESRQQSLARRVLGAPGAVLGPVSRAEDRVLAELRRTARNARKRVGF